MPIGYPLLKTKYDPATDLLRIYAKTHAFKNLRYYYVITEIGKPVISRCNPNFFNYSILCVRRSFGEVFLYTNNHILRPSRLASISPCFIGYLCNLANILTQSCQKVLQLERKQAHSPLSYGNRSIL
jgi:hypothetical protein